MKILVRKEATKDNPGKRVIVLPPAHKPHGIGWKEIYLRTHL